MFVTKNRVSIIGHSKTKDALYNINQSFQIENTFRR